MRRLINSQLLLAFLWLAGLTVLVPPVRAELSDLFFPPTVEAPKADGVSTTPPIDVPPPPDALGTTKGEDTREPFVPLHGKKAREAARRQLAEAEKRFGLTAEEKARARGLLVKDATLDRVLRGVEYSVVRLGPWRHAAGGKKIGAVADLRLDRKLTARRLVLPGVRYEKDGQPYRLLELHLDIVGAKSLFVHVDFEKKRVVDVKPDLGAKEIPRPGNPKLPPVHGGGR